MAVDRLEHAGLHETRDRHNGGKARLARSETKARHGMPLALRLGQGSGHAIGPFAGTMEDAVAFVMARQPGRPP